MGHSLMRDLMSDLMHLIHLGMRKQKGNGTASFQCLDKINHAS